MCSSPDTVPYGSEFTSAGEKPMTPSNLPLAISYSGASTALSPGTTVVHLPLNVPSPLTASISSDPVTFTTQLGTPTHSGHIGVPAFAVPVNAEKATRWSDGDCLTFFSFMFSVTS